MAESLIADGRVVRGYLGVVPQEITRELAEANDLGSTSGIMIASVESDTPADEAGIEAGDVVTDFGGVEITGVPQFRRVVAGVEPGEERGGRGSSATGDRRTLTATLAERPATRCVAEEPRGRGRGETGSGSRRVDSTIRSRQGVRRRRREKACSSSTVESGGPGADGGMQPGDVIVRIGDREIADLAEYRSVMKDLEGHEKAIAVMVQRGAVHILRGRQAREVMKQQEGSTSTSGSGTRSTPEGE